jgi:hypothetical protein
MYYEQELKALQKCSKIIVPVTKEDRIKYSDLYNADPHAFKTNKTEFYYMQMKQTVCNGKVQRIQIMGKPRHGKSEVAQFWTMLLIDVHNYAVEHNLFDRLKKQGVEYQIKILPKLNMSQILFSRSNFLYNLRKKQKEGNLILGEPSIVDEDESSIGGLGSMSEKIEMTNIDNIVAQAIQHEHQLRPDKFTLTNSNFCLFQEKMDRENRINWSMLYELRNEPNSNVLYKFLGWVASPLHFDDELRIEYNKMKKQNIIAVIEGTNDLRLIERVNVAKQLCTDEMFKQRTPNGKMFKLSVYQHECILNEWILAKKIQNFNIMEKQEIVQHARMIAERDYIKEQEIKPKVQIVEEPEEQQKLNLSSEFIKQIKKSKKQKVVVAE